MVSTADRGADDMRAYNLSIPANGSVQHDLQSTFVGIENSTAPLIVSGYYATGEQAFKVRLRSGQGVKCLRSVIKLQFENTQARAVNASVLIGGGVELIDSRNGGVNAEAQEIALIGGAYGIGQLYQPPGGVYGSVILWNDDASGVDLHVNEIRLSYAGEYRLRIGTESDPVAAGWVERVKGINLLAGGSASVSGTWTFDNASLVPSADMMLVGHTVQSSAMIVPPVPIVLPPGGFLEVQDAVAASYIGVSFIWNEREL